MNIYSMTPREILAHAKEELKDYGDKLAEHLQAPGNVEVPAEAFDLAQEYVRFVQEYESMLDN
jgi:6,7-dimethyl-8-ribityllumazine synthase